MLHNALEITVPFVHVIHRSPSIEKQSLHPQFQFIDAGFLSRECFLHSIPHFFFHSANYHSFRNYILLSSHNMSRIRPLPSTKISRSTSARFITSEFETFSICGIRSILRINHILQASRRLTDLTCSDQVSAPYNNTGHGKVYSTLTAQEKNYRWMSSFFY